MLRLDWPKLCTALNSLRAARQILNEGQAAVQHLAHHGGLHETEVRRKATRAQRTTHTVHLPSVHLRMMPR